MIYRTSGISGDEWLLASMASRGSTLTDSVRIGVGVDGLSAMNRDSVDVYYFSDQSATLHGNVNHYVYEPFLERVLGVFSDYLAERDSRGWRRFLGDETRFIITEAALQRGGIFDIHQVWTANREDSLGHLTHRTGEDMDIRKSTTNPIMRGQIRFFCLQRGIRCADHGNHLHFQVGLGQRRQPR